MIPVELYRNNLLLHVLHKLFNICFKFGKIPSVWCTKYLHLFQSVLHHRDPLSYRGITLALSAYKLYCSILDNRLLTWLDTRDIIQDEQNNFRKSKSTIDHLSTLTSIIETRKRRKLSTFADFKKAYDTVNRSLLFRDLNDLGIIKKK